MYDYVETSDIPFEEIDQFKVNFTEREIEIIKRKLGDDILLANKIIRSYDKEFKYKKEGLSEDERGLDEEKRV